MLLELCTWPEVEAYLGRSTGIILPHGSTEQHGPSGLFGTDWICAAAIARGIGERTGALVGPTIGLAANQFNLAFPGTISLRATTLMALVTDYVDSLARQGFTRFYVLNGHGGNVAPLRAAWHDLHADRRHPGIRARLRSWWELPTVNQLVDAMNLVSLTVQSPLGIYDWDQVAPPVLVRIGRPEETFTSISGKLFRAGGRLVLVDGDDVFGSPSQDAERTRVHEGTVRALAIVWAPAGVSNDWLESVLKEVSQTAEEFCDASVAESGILG